MFLQDVQAMVGIWICVLREKSKHDIMQTCKKQTHHKGPYDNSTIQLAKKQKLAVWMSMFLLRCLRWMV